MRKFFIVEDHPLMAKGLASQLTELFGKNFIKGSCESVKEALKVIPEIRPDVVFVDHHLQDGLGIELVEQLSGKNYDFILMSQIDSKDLLIRYFKAGVKALISKNDSGDVFAKIFEGEFPYVSPYYKEIMKRPSASDFLTDQEIRVLALVAKGFTNKEVGQELNCSEFTIKTHKTNIMRKLEINNSVGLSVWALKHQVI